MAKQSKNRVKLDKEKERLGVFTQPQLTAIRRVYKDVPGNAKRIRASISNSIKHNKEHLDQTERYLEQLGLTKEQYIRFIASNFNQIRKGQHDNTVVLAFCNDDLDHIAAVHLVFDKNENYWMVKSVRASRKVFFKKEDLIWEKK